MSIDDMAEAPKSAEDSMSDMKSFNSTPENNTAEIDQEVPQDGNDYPDSETTSVQLPPPETKDNGKDSNQPSITSIDHDKTPHHEISSNHDDNEIEEDDDDEVDESEDDEEDEDGPPLLKYSRTNKLPANFFDEEPISTCCFHENYFIFATHSGLVHICKPDFEHYRTFKAHRASVLSVYTDGVYFATGSMDGTVVIGSISDEKDITAYDFKRPIHAVILDTNYAKTGAFITGGMSGKVLYSSKNWLGKRVDVVLDSDKGPIVAVHILDDLLFWMNDKGITIYQISSKQIITTIDIPQDSPRGDLYWPRVYFPEADRILIAWGNYIWSLRVSLKTKDEGGVSSSTMSKILPSTASITFRAVQEKNVEIEHIYQLDHPICGITTFKDDLWMVLTFEPHTIDEESGEKEFHNPDLKLINSITGEVEFEEEIGLKGIQNLGLNDFLLGSHYGKSPTYYIVSAKDLVIAQEFQLDDRLEWFLAHDRYQEAWEMSEHLVTPIKRLNYGVQNVDNLIKKNEWTRAITTLKQLLYIDENELPETDGKSTTATSETESRDSYICEIVNLWTTWSHICINTNHIPQLTEVIPTNPKYNLSKSIYNLILEYWLKEDVERFYILVDEWSPELYDIKLLEETIEKILVQQPHQSTLRRYLTKLYELSFEPIKAVTHLLDLKDENIIFYISEHHIFDNFVKELPEMIKLKFTDTQINTLPIETIGSKIVNDIEILVNHRHEFSPREVIKVFKESNLDFVNYFYLQKLLEVDEYQVNDFCNERIQLLTLYDRSQLLRFLQKNSNYDIDKAIETCTTNDLTEELVYLLGRIGENKQALQLIIEKLNDEVKAIEFAKRQNDNEVWDILLEYSMTKPKFITALIEHADEQSNIYYDPITILKRMPKNVHIPGLSESVIKFSNNNELNLILNQLMLAIIYKQSETSSQQYRAHKLQGLELDPATFPELVQTFETLLVAKIANEYRITRKPGSGTDQRYRNMEKKLQLYHAIVGRFSQVN